MRPAHRRARRQVLVTAVILLLVLGLAVALAVTASARLPDDDGGGGNGPGSQPAAPAPASPEPEVVNSPTTTLIAECTWSEQRHREECVARGTTPQGGKRVTLSFNGNAAGDPSLPAVHLNGGFEPDNRTVDGTVMKASMEVDGRAHVFPPRPGSPERADGWAKCREDSAKVSVGLAWSAPLPPQADATAKRTERGVFQTRPVRISCDGSRSAGATEMTPTCAFGSNGQQNCAAAGRTRFGGRPIEITFNGNDHLETNDQDRPTLPGIQASAGFTGHPPGAVLEDAWITINGDPTMFTGRNLHDPDIRGLNMGTPCPADRADPDYPNDVSVRVSVSFKWRAPGEHGFHHTTPVQLSCSGRP